MSSIFILNIAEIEASEFTYLKIDGHTPEIFEKEEKLLDKLSNCNDAMIFILNKKDDNGFIIKVSEQKLFRHEYFLIAYYQLTNDERNLYLSLGYSDILSLPTDSQAQAKFQSTLLKHSKTA